MAATQGHYHMTQTPSPAEHRDLYRQKYDAQLREWQAKMDEVRAHSDKLSAQARLDMQPHLDSLHTKLDTARARFHELGSAAEDTWDEVKRNAESAWHELRSSLEGAYDALKGYAKSRKN